MSFTSLALILLLVGSALLVVGALRLERRTDVSAGRLLAIAIGAAGVALGCAILAIAQIRSNGRNPTDVLAIVDAVSFSVASVILFRASRHKSQMSAA